MPGLSPRYELLFIDGLTGLVDRTFTGASYTPFSQHLSQDVSGKGGKGRVRYAPEELAGLCAVRDQDPS